MWSLICETLSNILVLSLVLLAVGAAVTSMVLRKKRKEGGCGCNCASCPHGQGCREHT